MSKFLKIESITKRYKGSSRFAVDDISFSIKKGEFFGLLGPNGSGKTTLLSMIASLLKPTSGSILINGKSPDKTKEIIGFTPQDLGLYETLTLKENLIFFGNLYKLNGKLLKKRIDEALELSRLSTVYKNKISTFSGGMKRRANIAVALLHKPQLLILDEPTVGIDPQSRNLIFDSLDFINKSGTTLIYSTHYLEEIERLCTKIAIIDYGKLKLHGNLKKILANSEKHLSLSEIFLDLTGSSVRDNHQPIINEQPAK